jgi:hypothetical protein
LFAYLSNPRYFTKIAILILVVILAVEVIGVNLFLPVALPSEINAADARPMLQSLITFDGTLLGFSAIVYSAMVGRESSFERISVLFTSMIATLILFLLSVVTAFLPFALVQSAGLTGVEFSRTLGFMIYGVSVFFFMIYVHVARSKQAYR